MKRRWFQIHLSTAVVLMFCAGGLLWLNINGSILPIRVKWHPPPNYLNCHGWPFTWGFHYIALDSEEAATSPQGLQIHYGCLAADVGIAIGILVLAAAVMEFFLRRSRPA